MGKHYRHLTAEDRLNIYDRLFKGQPIPEIAQIMGAHKTKSKLH